MQITHPNSPWYRIREITCKWQDHSLVSNKYVSHWLSTLSSIIWNYFLTTKRNFEKLLAQQVFTLSFRLSQSRSHGFLVWCGRTRHELSLARSRFALTVALRAQKLDLWASLFKFVHPFLLLYLLCYLQNLYLFLFEPLFYRFHSIWEQLPLFQFHDTAKKQLTSV